MPELRTHIFLLTPTPNYATSHSAVSSVMFFDRNTSMSTDVASGLARRLLTISSALEYSLSEGTEVDGIPKYFSARCTSLGYLAVHRCPSHRCKKRFFLRFLFRARFLFCQRLFIFKNIHWKYHLKLYSVDHLEFISMSNNNCKLPIHLYF